MAGVQGRGSVAAAHRQGHAGVATVHGQPVQRGEPLQFVRASCLRARGAMRGLRPPSLSCALLQWPSRCT